MRYKILAIGVVILSLMVVLRRGSQESAQVFRGEATRAVYATGSVEPTALTYLSPKITARIIAILADEGDRIKKGDVLAKLDDSQERANLLELEAKEILAKQEYKRVKNLKDKNAVSIEEYDRAFSRLRASEALLKAANARVKDTEIIAPSDGLIIKRDGEVGDLITTQHKLFWVATDEKPRVTLEVDEEDISLVKQAQRVLLRSDAFPKQVFEGAVSAVTPKGDPISRSFRVRVSLPEITPLRFGMTIEANIIVETKADALLIPVSFLVEHDKVKIGSNQLKTVKTGIRGSQYVEILEGLNEGDLVYK
jgi:RND family efflux transporter MFP subunit